MMDLKHFEKISKALGDINRLRILEDMAEKGGAIQCSEIVKVLELAQPSVSHHIKTLIEAGLIEPEKNGRNYTYILNKPLLNNFVRKLKTIAG
jgi:ArsR family transcriptional regulator